jgi:hypothetical protein
MVSTITSGALVVSWSSVFGTIIAGVVVSVILTVSL